MNGTSRDPYIIQIGFDFGTSFCKCVCRDVYQNRAWVHVNGNSGAELPFLLPSAVKFKEGKLSRCVDSEVQYAPDSLHHVKLALEKVALREMSAPVLRQYRAAADDPSDGQLGKFVEAVAIFLIGSLMGEIVESILARPEFAGFGNNEKDYVALNMAIPVADADNKHVAAAFDRVLRFGWVIARDYKAFDQLDLEQVTVAYGLSFQKGDLARFTYPSQLPDVQRTTIVQKWRR